jgi:L-threonylcarbamoyladenylate synthase
MAEIWRRHDPIDVLRDVLAAGGVFAVPTESSYGLAVDPRDAAGVEAVFAIKGRDARQALPVVVADLEQLHALGVPRGGPELEVAASLWPAPLTVLFPIPAPLPATAGKSTVAARIPAHEGLRDVLRRLGHGLTATSANRTGGPPVLDPRDLRPLLAGRRAFVVDGGVLPGGPPSTLVDWAGGELRVLREGAFPIARLPRRLRRHVRP